MKNAFLAIALAGALAIGLGAPSALAQETETEDEAAEAARQGIESLMRALELMLDSIPMFEVPEILPNGDIIIRRVHPDDREDEEEDDPQRDEDGTFDETSA